MPDGGRRADEGAIARRVEASVIEFVEEYFAELPKPKDGEPGKPGKDAPEIDAGAIESRLAIQVASRVDSRVLEAFSAVPVPKDGLPGKDATGKRGPPGPRGPIGPMPRHEWRTLADGRVELRFQIAPDTWGPWSENLRGPRGFMSGGMGGGFTVIDSGGGNGNGGGTTTGDGSVPYFIPADETYTVPIYRQALFARTIDAEGMVDLEGDLILVN